MIAATNTQITDARAAFQKLSFRGSHSEFVAATTLITGLLDGLRAPGGPAVDLQAECVRIREGMQILNEYHERFGMTAVYAANLQEKLDNIAANLERDRQNAVLKAETLNRTLKAARARCALLGAGALVAATLGWELKNSLVCALSTVVLFPVAYVGWLALRSRWLIHLSHAACRSGRAQADEILNDIAIMTRLTKDAETVFANEMDSLRNQLGNVLDKLEASFAK
jgi:hypothetical protein